LCTGASGVSHTDSHTLIRDTSHLKAQLIEERQKFDQNVTEWLVKQWHPRLRSCIQEQGGQWTPPAVGRLFLTDHRLHKRSCCLC